MEKLLTLQEVSNLLGYKEKSCRFVRDLRKRGILKGAKIGKRLLFKESDVEEYVEKEFKKQN